VNPQELAGETGERPALTVGRGKANGFGETVELDDAVAGDSKVFDDLGGIAGGVKAALKEVGIGEQAL
jgi:hypothetical protein